MTSKIYVANQNSDNVTVIDGISNVTVTVTAGTSPFAVAVNPVTNKVYVANDAFSGAVTVIDGVSNSLRTVTAGTYPHDVAVNLITNQVYVPNDGSKNVTVLTEQSVQDIPLKVSITLAGNQTTSSTPTFSFTATSTRRFEMYKLCATLQGQA